MTPSAIEAENRVSCPASIRQALMEGGIEILGALEAERLFARVDGAAEGILSGLHGALQNEYGSRAGQGTALRLGRACFRSGIRTWSESAGLDGPMFRLMPSPRRIRAVLHALGELMENHFTARATLIENAASWNWQVAGCPACHRRVASAPDCHLLTGVLQETLAWAGGGRVYRVREVECSAAGAPNCLFQIDKKPLD